MLKTTCRPARESLGLSALSEPSAPKMMTRARNLSRLLPQLRPIKQGEKALKNKPRSKKKSLRPPNQQVVYFSQNRLNLWRKSKRRSSETKPKEILSQIRSRIEKRDNKKGNKMWRAAVKVKYLRMTSEMLSSATLSRSLKPVRQLHQKHLKLWMRSRGVSTSIRAVNGPTKKNKRPLWSSVKSQLMCSLTTNTKIWLILINQRKF